MAEKHPKRPRDPNQLAKTIIDIATKDAGEHRKPKTKSPAKSKRKKRRLS